MINAPQTAIDLIQALAFLCQLENGLRGFKNILRMLIGKLDRRVFALAAPLEMPDGIKIDECLALFRSG
jgi:hypothetical protein